MGMNILPFRPKVTDEQKEQFLLTAVTAECEAEDRKNNTVNIPYFMRARQRVDAIKLRGELDQEYNNYMKKREKHGEEQKQTSKI